MECWSEKEKEWKKKIDKPDSEKEKRQKAEKGGRVERFFPLPNISYPVILFTDKRAQKNCTETEYIQRTKIIDAVHDGQSQGNLTIDLWHLSIIYVCHEHKSDVLIGYKRNEIQIWVTSCFGASCL